MASGEIGLLQLLIGLDQTISYENWMGFFMSLMISIFFHDVDEIKIGRESKYIMTVVVINPGWQRMGIQCPSDFI